MSDPNRSESIIIKRVKKVSGGHHGGAWKVAYADFVTAMMAFFLLLWLLNVTTDEAKNKISSYFYPSHPRISDFRSGSGGLLGGLSISKVGAMQESTQPIVNPPSTTPVPDYGGTKTGDSKSKYAREGQQKGETGDGGKNADPKDIAEERLKEELRRREDKKFEEAEKKLKAAIEAVPELKKLKDNIKIDRTPEGLRIQILDQEGESMFPLGSSSMYNKTRQLLSKVSEVINTLPNKISIRGHTDAYKYSSGSDYTNWELSADRANASRRAMITDGIPADRFSDVIGKADTEPFVTEDPFDPKNRRMSIILLRQVFNTSGMTAGDIDDGDAYDYQNDYDDGYIPPPPEFRQTSPDVEFP